MTKRLLTGNIPDNDQATVTRINGFREHPDHDGPTISVECSPLVAPDIYRLRFVGYRTALVYRKAPKVALLFRIIDQGEYYETEVSRWYNVKRLMGKPGKSGKFQIGRYSDFLREYLTLFPDAANRLDRISFKPYRSNVITGRIETVTRNAKQKPLPELMQYSIIRELLEAGA